MTVLIGLTGKRGSGKNTVAEYIREWGQYQGLKVELQGFADRLKLSFARIFVPDATLEEAIIFSDYFKLNGQVVANGGALPIDIAQRFGKLSITGRQALQHYGTEAHREVFGDNFWVDQLLPEGDWTDSWQPDTDIAVITDVRFPNESQRVLDLNGHMFSVIRDSAVQTDTHASEQVLPSNHIHRYIDNNGSLHLLRSTVFGLMEALNAAKRIEMPVG